MALEFFRLLVRGDGLSHHFEEFYHFLHDFDRLAALLPEVMQHTDTPADTVGTVLAELTPLCKRRFYKKYKPHYDLGALKRSVAELVR